MEADKEEEEKKILEAEAVRRAKLLEEVKG